MPWAADTNILKHLTQAGTPEYAECVKALMTLRAGGESVSTFAQCAVEYFGFLTRPSHWEDLTLANPGLGLTTSQAEAELRRVESLFGVREETAVLYEEWRRIVLLYQVRGKNVHDARVAAAAHMHGVTHLLTYNGADFARYTAFLTAVHPGTL